MPEVKTVLMCMHINCFEMQGRADATQVLLLCRMCNLTVVKVQTKQKMYNGLLWRKTDTIFFCKILTLIQIDFVLSYQLCFLLMNVHNR